MKTEEHNLDDTAPQREHKLNLIYFVDSHKTHSIQMRLRTAVAAVISLSVLVIWSMVATGMLIAQKYTDEERAAKIRYLLDTVFQYQVRYDDVFEKAYQKEPKRPAAAPAVATQSVNPTPEVDTPEEKLPPEKVEDKEVSLAAKKAPETKPATWKATPPAVVVPPAVPAKPLVAVAEKPVLTPPPSAAAPAPTVPTTPTETEEPALDPASKELAVTINEIKARKVGSEIQVRFQMRNLRKPDLSTGILWGVAKFEGLDGKISYIASPSALTANSEGVVANYISGLRFSIRVYNTRSLSFAVPSQYGTFKEVKLFMVDDNKNQKVVSYPLNIQNTESTEMNFPNTSAAKNDLTPPDQNLNNIDKKDQSPTTPENANTVDTPEPAEEESSPP